MLVRYQSPIFQEPDDILVDGPGIGVPKNPDFLAAKQVTSGGSVKYVARHDFFVTEKTVEFKMLLKRQFMTVWTSGGFIPGNTGVKLRFLDDTRSSV